MRVGVAGWIAPLGTAALLGVIGACASQGAPPGGEPDRLPPVVVETRPDTFEVLERLDGDVRIRFSERISERPTVGTLGGAVVVSPRTGAIRVEHDRQGLDVELAGGFQPGLVYRVTVLPVIQDMFDNPMADPFEFVFSTGAEFTPTAVAGLVLDRLTGQPVPDASIQLIPAEGDTSVTYVARSDSGGIFAVRYLPPGPYDLVAFMDRDRDQEPGALEPQGRVDVALSGPADTTFTDVVILEPDTTPARVAQAEPVDSAVIRLTFDDHLDPDQDLDDVGVTLERDTLAPAEAPPPPNVVRVLSPARYDQHLDSLARLDSIAGGEAADTLEAPARPVVPPGQPQGAGPTQEASGSLLDGPLPYQELLVLLEGPLPVEIPYQVVVDGVVNVHGIPGGGGSVRVLRRAPPAPPDTVEVPDTMEVPDTVEVSDTAQPSAIVQVPYAVQVLHAMQIAHAARPDRVQLPDPSRRAGPARLPVVRRSGPP